MATVQFGQQVEFFALLLARQTLVADVLNQAVGTLLFGVDVRPLVDGRKEGRTPELVAYHRQTGT
jgi:hypothetical protein